MSFIIISLCLIFTFSISTCITMTTKNTFRIILYLQSVLVNGSWTEWSTWDGCSVSCGDGTSKRNRSCTNPPPQYDGLECEGADNETKHCNLANCPSELEWKM